MFTVKATYRGETRKLTFPLTFPTFAQLCEQLRRVFPLTHAFTISRLLFSPNSTKSIRLLIGQRVHTAEDYMRYIEPYRQRPWQDATLRLTVLDGNSGEGSTATSSTSHHQPQAADSGYNDVSSNGVEDQVSFTGHPISMSCIPPPPILFSQVPDTSNTQCTSRTLADASAGAPLCCSVEANKKEIRTLLDNFMHDLNGLVNTMFPVRDASELSSRGQRQSDETRTCTRCKRDTKLMPYYCNQCGADVCFTCGGTVACNNCPAVTIGYHHLVRRSRVPNRFSRHPKHTVRIPQAPRVCSSQAAKLSDTARSTGHNTTLASIQSSAQFSSWDGARRSRIRERAVVHNAACDLCDSGIRGARYKCLVCPDFDTCASCFSITEEQHPNHSFIKLSHPTDYIHRAALRPRHRAVCDVCNAMIFGIRYKCLHPDCPDFDLCERCEGHPIPQHPEYHPLLKLKFPNTTIPSVQTVQVSGATRPISTVNKEATAQDSPIGKATPQLVDQRLTLPPGLSAVSTSSNLHAPPEMSEPVGVVECSEEKEEIAATLGMGPNCEPEVEEPPVASPSMSESKPILSPVAPPSMSEPKPIPSPVCTLPDATSQTMLVNALPEDVLEERQTRPSLDAMDITVPNGQTFPPGAEFIKTWQVTNNGSAEWPETTELIFTGGNVMMSNLEPISIGKVEAGGKAEISTRELKAPELPGHYVSCWRLRTREVGSFGESLWIDIYVAEPQNEASESLSSSSVMKMPHPASRENSREGFEDKVLPARTSERSADVSDAGTSETAGTLDNLSYDSDWQDCPADPVGGEDYVILYEDSSSEEN
ncbi:hypothetical protein AX15_000643 [Amanita polypyramis BW_CC]|nr:hypothetical protein AX15_000643 [Amanita polypyramis BW_CC]